MRRRPTLALITLFLLAAAPAALAANDAKVRVVHASPDTGAVDVLVNDQVRAFTGVQYGTIEEYRSLPAGAYNVKVVASGAGAENAPIDADLNLMFNRSYTVIAVDFFDDIAPVVLTDRNQPAPFNKARVRLFHGSPDAGPVDVKVVGGPFLFQNVDFKETGDYITVPSGTYDLEVRAAGTDFVALSLPGITLDGGTTYTVYAIGLLTGTPALDARISVDRVSPARARAVLPAREIRARSID